jgi:SAM-dependent methyltransferase
MNIFKKNLTIVLFKMFGLKIFMLYGDPLIYDRWKFLRKYLLSGNYRTLDVGSGSGFFTIYAAAIGNTSIGISIDEHNNQAGRDLAEFLKIKNLKILDADLRDLERLSNDIGFFDQIICFETIEHVKDDEKLILGMSRILKPGGRLILTTPNKNYKPLIFDEISECEDGGHVRWGYTVDELSGLLKRYGIRIIYYSYISGLISQKIANFDRRLIKCNYWLRLIIVTFFRLFMIFDELFTRITKYPYLSIGVVGIKNSK